MEQLFLADLKDMSDEAIREHIAIEYSDENRQGGVADGAMSAQAIREMLNYFDILIAQESVGDFGCDSSSWFLLRNRVTGELAEINGAHCSCYGFEGQFELEPIDVKVLAALTENDRRRVRFVSCGWTCEGEDEDNDAVLDYVLRNFKQAPVAL